MFEIFSLIIDHWPVIIGTVVPAGAVLVFMVPGLRSILWKPLAFMAAVLLVYFMGKHDAKKAQEQKTKIIDEKRNQAYDDIAARNTGSDDVADRLRNGRF